MNQTHRDYSEKRDYIRMTVEAQAILSVDGRSIPAVCHDLSSTGMQVQAQSALRVGDQVSVLLPTGHASLKDLDAEAEVVRVQELAEGQQVVGLSIVKMH